jgi:hypothetical protein
MAIVTEKCGRRKEPFTCRHCRKLQKKVAGYQVTKLTDGEVSKYISSLK